MAAELTNVSSAALVVSERTLTFAARTGYLEGLREWGRQGVRVESAADLCYGERIP
jgi:hypothetical protein